MKHDYSWNTHLYYMGRCILVVNVTFSKPVTVMLYISKWLLLYWTYAFHIHTNDTDRLNKTRKVAKFKNTILSSSNYQMTAYHHFLSQPNSTSTPVGSDKVLSKVLPGNLGSWFSVCNLILTQLDEIWRKQ